MKRLVCSAVILLVVMSVSTAHTADSNRTATVRDIAGVASDVTYLCFAAEKQKFDDIGGGIALSVGPFDIAIPIDNVISVDERGDSHAVSYLWRGKEFTITGKLFSGEFICNKNAIYDLKLQTYMLKSL